MNFGFIDWLFVIFFLAAVCANTICFFKCRKGIHEMEVLFNPKNDRVNGVIASMEWTGKEISELKEKRKQCICSYSWYANLTAVFPLLGIMGTVASLVSYKAETMMDNFMVALWTTLFGVLFAILFKCIDAIISGPLDVVVSDADSVIQRKENKNDA